MAETHKINPVTRITHIFEKLKSTLSTDSDIAFAYLFGSHAGGQPTPLSDIDVAVYLRGILDGNKRMEILGVLIDKLKTDRIDLVILNTAPLPLKMRVIRKSRLLVENSPFVRHAFESATVSTYIDFARYENRILKERFSF